MNELRRLRQRYLGRAARIYARAARRPVTTLEDVELTPAEQRGFEYYMECSVLVELLLA